MGFFELLFHNAGTAAAIAVALVMFPPTPDVLARNPPLMHLSLGHCLPRRRRHIQPLLPSTSKVPWAPPRQDIPRESPSNIITGLKYRQAGLTQEQSVQIYSIWGLFRGRWPFDVHQLHLKYGPILRTMPNELTFTDPQAWKDIYGHRQGHPQFHKDRESLNIPLRSKTNKRKRH